MKLDYGYDPIVEHIAPRTARDIPELTKTQPTFSINVAQEGADFFMQATLSSSARTETLADFNERGKEINKACEFLRQLSWRLNDKKLSAINPQSWVNSTKGKSEKKRQEAYEAIKPVIAYTSAGTPYVTLRLRGENLERSSSAEHGILRANDGHFRAAFNAAYEHICNHHSSDCATLGTANPSDTTPIHYRKPAGAVRG